MPTAKGKGGSTSHRYRPASEYDDAALALKREYWRNKKREQRARLSERRGRPKSDGSQGKPQLNAAAEENSTLSWSSAALSSPPLSNKDSFGSESKHVSTFRDGSLEPSESQKETWIQTVKLNELLPQLPASCSILAGGDIGKRQTARGGLNRAATSATSSGTQLNTTSSVPAVRVTRIANGSSTKTPPQPCVSMQGATGPQSQHEAPLVLPTQPKVSPTSVTADLILVSSPCGPVSINTESKTTITTPQRGTKSALVTTHRTKGASNARPSLESDEERAAKRREQWRLKKREQRAKQAVHLAKARERIQGAETTFQRLTAQKTGLLGSVGLPSPSFLRGAGQKACHQRVKVTFPSARGENNSLQSGAATVAITTLRQSDPNPSVKRPSDSQRKLPGPFHLFSITRGIARCKTPRQRFIDAQKNYMNQRSLRCKSPMLASVFGVRSIPKIDPNDTPEQIIAKRREYWRLKKREQRAKLSMEVKARLKERDSLMRRVKRYQKILEDMRKARALTHSTAHASETIGGFIKEDGTLTANIPHGPTEFSAAQDEGEEELHVVCKNRPLTQQPEARLRIDRLPPSLCLAQVKVSVPVPGQPVCKSTRLLPISPPTQLQSTAVHNSHSLAVQTGGQLTLARPHNAASEGSAAGSDPGGCVMKMTVSSRPPSLDQGLTEEARMAKKREYWRIKKREQRAARAVRLRQGVLHSRASAAFQRRKAQKQVSVAAVPQSRNRAQPLPNSGPPLLSHANQIKQESESTPAADLNSQPEQAICPDIKPPTSPPPAPPLASEPALSTDSQATTLLAVASMKKLLEESLSTVTECKSEQNGIKREAAEEAAEQDVKPNLPQLFLESDDMAPIAADLTLQINSWQTDGKVSVQAGLPGPQLHSSAQTSETLPPFASSCEEVMVSTCDHSSQTSSSFILNTSMEAPRRNQRLHTKTAGHQTCCIPEPPKLHHITAAAPDNLQPPQQHCEQHNDAQEQNNSSESAQKYHSAGTGGTERSVGAEHSGLTSLQRKREYWKLMKRQQRARLKARQKDRQGDCSSRLLPRSIQGPGLFINSFKGLSPSAKRALQPKPSVTSLDSVSSIPTVLVVSPATCSAEQSARTLRVRPVTGTEQNAVSPGPSHVASSCAGVSESPQLLQTSESTEGDSAPSLPTLKPPDNPLSSINMQLIEPPSQTPVKISSAQLQGPTQLAPTSTMVPPKPIPGESEEDFLRRKREYWRIKKKEQRARKAIRDKGITPTRDSNSWKPILPVQDLETEDSGPWVNSSEESEHLMSTSVDTDSGSFPYSGYTASVEDESELLFADCEEDPVSDSVWRSRYLMDYDPLNQLLVCMVCGELQYSHSLEGVRAHIDEAHPHTLTLEPGEKQQIREAWDEQVSQRERFFTSQLQQQHSGALAEVHRN